MPSMPRVSTPTGGDALMPMIPSQAQKQQQKREAEISAWMDEQAEEFEAERLALTSRAESAELQCAALEAKIAEDAADHRAHLEALHADMQTKLADMKEASGEKAHEAERRDREAAENRATLENDKSEQAARIAELGAKLSKLESQVPQLEARVAAEVERAGGLEAKLAQAHAERRGVEALAQQNEKQWQSMLTMQVNVLTQERTALEARLASTEAKVLAGAEQRDAEAAKIPPLQGKLATTLAELNAASERILLLERELKQERETWPARLEAAEGARGAAVAQREAALADMQPLHAQLVKLTAEHSALSDRVPRLEKQLQDEQAAHEEALRLQVHTYLLTYLLTYLGRASWV